MSVKVRIAAVLSVAALLFGGSSLGTETSASALSQITSNGVTCAKTSEVRVASRTTGQTYHFSSLGQSWNKGVKQNAGATSYTGKPSLSWVSTTAPTIHSSGFACR